MITVDKQKIYESHGYKFKNFVLLSHDEKIMILNWRNNETVRKVMINKDTISEHNHLRFIEGLKERDDCYYWLVINGKDEKIGVIDILHVDKENDVGELGYYMDPSLIGMGLEFVVECEFFVYNIIKLGNNIATVNVKNKSALLLNTYLGDTYEGLQTIDGESFFYNNHANGNYLIEHYLDFNLDGYLTYMRKHKNIANEIKERIKKQTYIHMTMEINTFIKNFADQFDDTEASEFTAETNFRELEEWSSMIALSILNMVGKEYGYTMSFDEMRDCNTVQELFDLVSAKVG